MSCSQASRCLECSTFVNLVWMSVQTEQILLCMSKENHKLSMLIGCNECGNCETFCPYASAPYKDKFTLFNSEADFMTVLIQVSMFKILWIKFVYCVYGERCQQFN